MIRFSQVYQLMDDHVIDQTFRYLQQAPIEAESAGFSTGTPAEAEISDIDLSRRRTGPSYQ